MWKKWKTNGLMGWWTSFRDFRRKDMLEEEEEENNKSEMLRNLTFQD